jgi:hypothetical protein
MRLAAYRDTEAYFILPIFPPGASDILVLIVDCEVEVRNALGEPDAVLFVGWPMISSTLIKVAMFPCCRKWELLP